jgi:hypothetical protein
VKRALGATNASTNSISWVAIPDMNVAGTTSGGDVLALFSATTALTGGSGNRTGEYSLWVDGAQVYTTSTRSVSSAERWNVSFQYLVTDLAAGPHTFEVRWRVYSTTHMLEQSAASWGAGRSLIVTELVGN